MSVFLYSCNICKKQFKTNQHLNQHKNRKKSCVMTITNHHLDETVLLPKKTFTNDVKDINSSLFDLKLFDILEMVKCTKQYKNKIQELELDKKNLQEQIDIIKKVISTTTRNSDSNSNSDSNHVINKNQINLFTPPSKPNPIQPKDIDTDSDSDTKLNFSPLDMSPLKLSPQDMSPLIN